MVFNNFISRIIISFLFITSYGITALYKFEYIFFIILLIYILIIYEILKYFKNKKFYILIYIFLSFASLLTIKFNSTIFYKFNLMITIIVSFDIFSYLIGSVLGKTKIMRNISPNKTLEGLIGGVIFSIIISLVYCIIFEIKIDFLLIIFLILIIISSFLGDVIESTFKRINNLKNSSELLLGHGGFFDRFDSFLLSLVTFSLLSKIL